MASNKRDVAKELKRIERAMNELSRQLREEHRIAAAEMADRQRKWLTGDAAVEHYNDWMMLHGLSHLCVE